MSKHLALRPQKLGCLLGTGTGGGGGGGGGARGRGGGRKIERMKGRPRAPTRKTEEAVDLRQNNRLLSVLSPLRSN